jgi:polyisoprenoid-binding protein YceI
MKSTQRIGVGREKDGASSIKPFLRIHTLLVLCCSGFLTPTSHAESYTIDPTHTYPSFEVSHLGFSTQRGRFNRTSGKITLDLQAQTGSADILIDAGSVDTGLEILEERLRGPQFFNVAQYPSLSFKSDSFRFEGGRLVGVDGVLTLLGTSRPVSFAVTGYKCGAHLAAQFRFACGADAETTIRRSEFGVNGYLPFVGDEVKLRIQVEALRD